MPIITQLIGKTSAVKGGLFRIKQRLELLGFVVKHPVSDSIIAAHGKHFVYDPNIWSEYEVALDMAENVRDNDLHIVSNDIGGIIGKQAALSIVYAMINDRPVVITHKPYFRPNVDPQMIKMINRNHSQLNFQNLLKLSNTDLKPCIELIAAQTPAYRLTKQERTNMKRAVRNVLREALNN